MTAQSRDTQILEKIQGYCNDIMVCIPPCLLVSNENGVNQTNPSDLYFLCQIDIRIFMPSV